MSSSLVADKTTTSNLVLMFGGTFDPVHHGHLRSAVELTQALPVYKLHLIPCQQPVHRNQPQATTAQRLAMLQLALADEPKIYLDERELRRPSPSWSIDTLASLREDYGPDQPLALVIGWDAFCGLSSWSRYTQLLELGHLVVLTRPGQMHPAPQIEADFLAANLASSSAELTASSAGKILELKLPSALEISATYIRNLIASGLSARYLVPPQVLDFIFQQQLYQQAE